MSRRGLTMTEEQLRAFVARGQRAQTAVNVVRGSFHKVIATSPLTMKTKKNKYNAQPQVTKEGKFASKKELRCWQELKLREKAGEIACLRRQVKFSLFGKGGEHIGVYTADFVWRKRSSIGWIITVADAKSEATKKRRDWARTKKLMMACHGIDVLEL